LQLAQSSEVMVIGGGKIYQLALPLASRLVITHVDTVVDGGQAWFPQIEPDIWLELEREHRTADADNPHDLEFVEYQRK
jgi:dihydrofolate reductase